jgi:UDP-N-acetylmuramoyl-tripeptide--D-alanyl-D-alanine ligase
MKQFLKKSITKILELEARTIIKKYRPKIIAVTGSVGKTSTKDAIYTLINSSFHAQKSEKSLNSEIGVPLTVIGRPSGWNNPLSWISTILHGLELIFLKSEYPEYLILEVGADHPGDIAKVVKWIKPDVSVITRVGDVPVHVEFFSSPEEVLAEKANLAKGTKKTGTVVLSADDDRVIALKESINRAWVSYGIDREATVKGEYVRTIYREGEGPGHGPKRPIGVSFRISIDGNSIPVEIKGSIGKTHVYPLLAAVAVAKAIGVPQSAILSSISSHATPRGRMCLIDGQGGSTIIDDTYNSSPDALREALNVLRTTEVNTSSKAKRIAILGDMMELGSFSRSEHIKAGERVKESADVLITVGQRMAVAGETTIARGMNKGMVVMCRTSEEAVEAVKPFITPGSVILVKGSQSVRMERIVKALMVKKEQAEDLLVRQDIEWLNKK